MAHKFKSMAEMKHFLENMVNAALDTTVKDGVIKTLEDYAKADVYEEYPAPKMYNRRRSLLQDSNYEVDKAKNMKLTITPVAKFNPNGLRWDKRSRSLVPASSWNVGDELAGLINYGDGWNGYNYEYVSEEEMENPTYTAQRPFIDDAKESLDDGMGFKTLLSEGLGELGIKVEWK